MVLDIGFVLLISDFSHIVTHSDTEIFIEFNKLTVFYNNI